MLISWQSTFCSIIIVTDKYCMLTKQASCEIYTVTICYLLWSYDWTWMMPYKYDHNNTNNNTNKIIIITIVIINADLHLAVDPCQGHPTWQSWYSTIPPDISSSLHAIHAVCHHAYQPCSIMTDVMFSAIWKFQTTNHTSTSVIISGTCCIL